MNAGQNALHQAEQSGLKKKTFDIMGKDRHKRNKLEVGGMYTTQKVKGRRKRELDCTKQNISQ